MPDITIPTTGVRVQDGSLVVKLKAGEASTLGKAVQVTASESVTHSNASVAGTLNGAVGLIVSGAKSNTAGTIALNETIGVLFEGIVWISGADMTPGAEIFFSDTPGLLSDTPGTVARRAGVALSATLLYFQPNLVAIS